MKKIKLKGNGCGAEGSWFRPPYGIMFFTSCEKHDDLYEKGGNYIDRYIADIYLLEYMKMDVGMQKWWKQPYFFMWTYIYYIGVRIGGKKYFNYKINLGK